MIRSCLLIKYGTHQRKAGSSEILFATAYHAIRDIDSNGYHIDTVPVDDIDGSNGKNNDRSGLENDLDMKMSIIPLTLLLLGFPRY